MSYLEELLPEFRKGAKIRRKYWSEENCISINRSMGLHLSPVDTQADDWEICREPEPDWQYIIDHKCLCWFWEDDEEKRIANYLQSIGIRKNNSFIDVNTFFWENCRPVRRDEVTFYEDRKDER